MFCKAVCTPSDPTKDSVRIDMAAIAQERKDAQLAEEVERLWQEEERLRQEQQRREEEERLQREEQQRQEEERAKLEREEQARRERERRAEAERRAREEEKLRKETLEAFYKRHGFVDANTPRHSGCAVLAPVTTYPLHWAAELADARIVELLLKEGVATAQKNSSGRTAAQVAQRKNKGGSHDAVLRLLAAPARPKCGGA
mmetsp:Transcript_37222/g.115666  ORF Transcript_37222/g.115666 Transcript_37222/m.115666 type:complete len:201 (-) Transcript_37222:342-944(-)